MNKYHLTFKDSKWKLKPEGASRAVKTFEKKRDAIKGSAEYLRARRGRYGSTRRMGRSRRRGRIPDSKRFAAKSTPILSVCQKAQINPD